MDPSRSAVARPPWLSEHSMVSACAVAIGAVVVATAITFELSVAVVHSRSIILTCAIILSAWYGGFWPGMLASALSVLSFDYFFDATPGVIDRGLQAGIRAVVFVAVTTFITYLTAQRRRALMEVEKAMEEIRVLRGIIPICMHCRQVRNDVGSWQQVEQYVSEHSEAAFSHGVCPDCLRKFYPEVAEKQERAKARTGDL